jgi:hypothetical protein
MNTLWTLFIIVAGRGGIGKTLLAALLTTALLKLGRPPLLVQADIQRRLDALFPDLTTTINIDKLEELEKNPLALARAFAAIPTTMRICAAGERDEIVDTAATWHTPIVRYCAEIRLAEKVAALRGRLIFLVPTTADTDSLLLAVDTAQMIETMVPMAQLVLVLNAHPTSVSFDVPDVIKKFGKAELQRVLKAHRQIVLPAISPAIWGVFERANLSPIDVIASDPKDLMALVRADIDTIEIMQGRVEKWLNGFIAGANKILLPPRA